MCKLHRKFLVDFDMTKYDLVQDPKELDALARFYEIPMTGPGVAIVPKNFDGGELWLSIDSGENPDDEFHVCFSNISCDTCTEESCI